MESLSLITAVAPHLTQHLPATAASVGALRIALAPFDWSVTWIVAVDGPGQVVAPGADQVIYQSRPAGVSATRNLAIAQARPGWLFPLDADDLIDPAGFVELVRHPQFGSALWHPTNRLTLEGDRTVHWFDQAASWPKGELEEHWTAPFPFHPNSIVASAELVQAIGGYPALRINEDILYVFNLNNHAAGLAIPSVTLRYRKWDHQTVADPHYLSDKAHSFEAIATMVNARRARAGLFPIEAPRVLPDWISIDEVATLDKPENPAICE